MIFAVTAGLGAVPNSAALAAELTVTTSEGRTLHVGDVVASGHPNGDLCLFPDGAEIRLSGTNTNTATFTADSACNLSVSKITDALSRPIPVSAGARPKYNEDIDATVSPSGGGVGGVSIGGTGTGDVESTINALADAAKPKWQQEVYSVYVAQPVYDAAGLRQYEDWIRVEYIEEWNATEGRVRGIQEVDGACLGGIGGDVTRYDPLTEIRNCWYRTLTNGYTTVSAKTGGSYRQGWRTAAASVTTDERTMTEYIEASYLQWDYSCNVGVSLPMHWYSDCIGKRVSLR